MLKTNIICISINGQVRDTGADVQKCQHQRNFSSAEPLSQNPSETDSSVPILQVGRVRWGMVCLNRGWISKWAVEVDPRSGASPLGGWDSVPLHRGNPQRWTSPVMGIISSLPRRQSFPPPLSSNSSLQVRLENWYLSVLSPQLLQDARAILTIWIWVMVSVAPWNFINDCRSLPCSCAVSLVSSLGKLRQMNRGVILTQMYPYFCTFLWEKLNHIESCFCRLS